MLRASAKNRTIVEAVDPAILVVSTGNAALEPIAADARIALTAALNSLNARRPAVMTPTAPRAGRATAERIRWPRTRVLFLIAGIVTLLGVTLGVTASPWFLLLPAMAGANQLLMVATGWCPMSLLLTRFAYRHR